MMAGLDPVIIAIIILIGLALLLSFIFNQKYESGEIVEVLDGDSLIVSTEKHGEGVKVRLAGIDAPERSSSIFHKHEKFARQSSRYVEERLPPHTKIYLEYDKQKWDQYGRLLAYVYLSKTGESINEELVKKGYAAFKAHPRNKKYEKVFQRREKHARKYRNGIWRYQK